MPPVIIVSILQSKYILFLNTPPIPSPQWIPKQHIFCLFLDNFQSNVHFTATATIHLYIEFILFDKLGGMVRSMQLDFDKLVSFGGGGRVYRLELNLNSVLGSGWCWLWAWSFCLTVPAEQILAAMFPLLHLLQFFYIYIYKCIHLSSLQPPNPPFAMNCWRLNRLAVKGVLDPLGSSRLSL